MTKTVVLVHGAWHGAWCWDKVVPLLDAAGVPAIAVDLPGHGESTDAIGDLAGDAAYLTGVLDELGTDAVVCGHSYGGAVITQATHPRTHHLVYVSAFQLEPGESCTQAAADMINGDEGTTELGSAFRIDDEGMVTLDHEIAARAFYHDCEPADVAWALHCLGPHHMSSLTQAADQAAWKEIDSTYVVCTDDRAVSAQLQRALASRATSVVDWPTSHSPFLSRPQLVADLLADLSTQP